MSPPTLADIVAAFEDAVEPILDQHANKSPEQADEVAEARALWSAVKSWLDLEEAAT